MEFEKSRLESGLKTCGGMGHEKAAKRLPVDIGNQVTNTKLLINGSFVTSSTDESFETFNPSTEDIITIVPRASAVDTEAAIKAARVAYDETDWPQLTQLERGLFLRQLARLIEDNEDLFIYLGGVDAGALRHNAKEDVKHCIALLELFSHLTGDCCSGFDDGRSVATHNCTEPSGVIAAIMSSQNPLCSLAEVLGPALAYGNTVVAIIPSDAPLSALQFAALVDRAGFPKGTVNILTGIDVSKSTHLATHADIDRIVFHGASCSTETLVAAFPLGIPSTTLLRSASNNPHTVILGRGESLFPAIISADVDVISVVDCISTAVFKNEFSVKTHWILIDHKIYTEFTNAIIQRANDLSVGDPFQYPSSQVGPLCSKEEYRKVIAGITSYKQSGGKIISGGARTGAGFFVRPTVIEFCSAESLTNLDPIGGPVICLYMVKNDEEAASIANEVIGNTIGATSCVAVFSNNLETISRFTKKSVLKSNIVLVNSLDDTPLRTMEVSTSHLTYTNRKSVHIKSMIKGNKVKIPVSESDQQM